MGKYFSLEIIPEWKELFDEDTLSYLKSAQEKVFFTILDMNGYYYVKESTQKAYAEWNSKLFTEGRVSNFPESTVNVEFYYGQLPSNLLLSKTVLTFFNTLHSFFDTYGHFLHKSLFPMDSIPPKLYFSHVVKKIQGCQQMSSIADTLENFTYQYIYSYIVDIDNTNKHRDHISPQLTVWLNDGDQTTELPAFEKDGRKHYDFYLEDALEDSNKFVIELFNEVTKVVTAYLKNQSKVDADRP